MEILGRGDISPPSLFLFVFRSTFSSVVDNGFHAGPVDWVRGLGGFIGDMHGHSGSGSTVDD